MLTLPALAQSKYTLKGHVTSSVDNLEVIGASVQVEGTTIGTVTDFDGNFTLDVSVPKGNLVISYVGCKTMKVAFSRQKTSFKVVLMEDAEILDEVVVVGYGSMRKKEVTGAVARVAAEELGRVSTSDLGTALQGLVAGVNVQASSGEPGAKSNIQIRGLSSIAGGNSPLYVVDGVPYEGDPGLSSNEIESIDILKDAASAAIYGTRGAAGVILITTKQGKAGEMKVSVDGYYGVQKITSGIDLMNTSESIFVDIMVNRMQEGVNNTDNAAWTSIKQYPVNFFNDSNLYNVVTNNNAPVQNYSVTVSGGQKDLTYNLSANYFDQEGILINSDFKRYNVRSNVNFKRNKWSINTSLSFRIEDQLSPAWDLMTQSYSYSPTSSQVDPDADITQTAGDTNQLTNMSNTLQRIKEYSKKKTEAFNGNFFVGYDVMKGLNVSTRLGIGYSNQKALSVNPVFQLYNQDGEEVTSSTYRSQIRENHAKNSSLTWESMLNYNLKIGKHDIKATGVFSLERYGYESFYASIKDLVSNDINNVNAGTNDMMVGTGSGQWGQDRVNTLVGMIARAQYSYGGRYMASVSLRRDASSRFSKENRWGMFPSVSVGWNISEEQFWKKFKNVANSFKVRASFGTTGNQNFADYSYSAPVNKNYDYTFGLIGKEFLGLGFAQSTFSNADVKWETTQQINGGIDLAFLDNRITFTADIYKSNKKNMLFPMIVPASSGSGQNSTVTLNAGNMENKGFELALGHRNRVAGIDYNMNLTFSRNVNRIVEMAGPSDMYYFADGKPVSTGTDFVTVIKKGYEAGAFFVMPTNGIADTEEKLADYQKIESNARMGDLIYVDTNKDGKINDDDRVYGGSGMPECELGFNLWAGYKGFDLSMNWYASIGNEIINATKIYTYQSKTNKELIYMWTPTNPTSTIPTYRGSKSHNNYRAYSDIWVEDGSFLRLKNIMLGYSLPKSLISRIGINKLRFYVAADNLLTFTPYEGYDPEVGSNGLSRRGLDFGTYPISIQIRGGFQLQF